MRICLVNPFFYPHVGGIELRMREVGVRLIERGHEVYVLTSRLNGTPAEAVYAGMRVVRVPARCVVPYNPPSLWVEGGPEAIYRALSRLRPDIVDFQYRWAPDYTLAMERLMRRSSTGMVFTFHNVFGEGKGFLRPLSYLNDAVLSIHLKKYDRVLCVSEWVRRDLISRGFCRERIRVVPNGVDSSVARGMRVRDDGFALFIGRLVRTKGIHHLLRALALVHERGVDLRLKVAGDGPQRDRLLSLTRSLGISDSVEFLGRVPDSEKWELYASCSYLVLPSISESFGLVLLEGMTFGKPVVATQVGGIPEIVGEAGILVPPGDERALAEGMLTMALSPQFRAGLSRLTGERVDMFSWDGVCDRLEDTYLEVLGLPLRPRRYAYETPALTPIIRRTANRET